ncbi:hypothetical protein [Streptomyces sp. NPDC090022]|uniref:hypothetical protein n=1 Tax=Streptomyces sp. NPDC090022 TaxID=3365920 RepID=UPI0037F880EB
MGPSRGFTTHDVLLKELGLLDGASGGFVEFENSHGEMWNVEWNGSWSVNDAPQDAPPFGLKGGSGRVSPLSPGRAD